MVKSKQITVAERASITTLYDENYSIRLIARKLRIAKSTVHDTITRYKDTGDHNDRIRSGRPKVTTSAEIHYMRLMSKRNRRLTAPEIRADFNRNHSKEISLTTTKRVLRSGNLLGRVAVRKPFLRRINRLKRLQWGQKCNNWTYNDWSKVLWTDESKFQIFGQNRRIYVRRSPSEKMLPECIVPTLKHGGGSVMVWGCFSGSGIGDLVRIDGIMKKEEYKEILETHAIPSGLRLNGPGFIFMQDNDPKHTSKLCRSYIKDKENCGDLKYMDWPSQSPDLNPIEMLWDHLDREVRKKCPTSKESLWTALQESWNAISSQTIQNLLFRMPRLAREVIKTKGNFFDENKV